MSRSEQIENRRWVAEKLRSCRFVEWDRFTVNDWNGEQSLSVYGWIDRDDAYKDFVLVIFWPESEGLYSLTSSSRHSEELTRILHGDADGHTDCRRVEDTFNVANSIQADGGRNARYEDTATNQEGDRA